MHWIDVHFFLRPHFRLWVQNTRFWPKPEIPPNVDYIPFPVRQYLEYHGNMFARDYDCLGVTFVTFLPMFGHEVCIVWTTTRRAHMFKYAYSKGWMLFKTLHRQDDPLATWLRHLGGGDPSRFGNEVIPYFGTHPLLTRTCGILAPSHATWELVKRVSRLTLAEDHPDRFEWYPLSSRPAPSR